MGRVPGTISWFSADVVINVPSQAAACDTAGVMKRNAPALRPFSYASLLIFVMYSGSPRGLDLATYYSTFSFFIASEDLPHTIQPEYSLLLTSSYGLVFCTWNDAWKPLMVACIRGVSKLGPLSWSGGDMGDSGTGNRVLQTSILDFPNFFGGA